MLEEEKQLEYTLRMIGTKYFMDICPAAVIPLHPD
jgi:hypothetical protein